jgi:hypothetical protein
VPVVFQRHRTVHEMARALQIAIGKRTIGLRQHTSSTSPNGWSDRS